MEFLFNLVWLLLSLTLVCKWLPGTLRDVRKKDGWKTQAIALLLIIIVLLPAVSITDDLQSFANEGEHIVRRHEALLANTLDCLAISVASVVILPSFALYSFRFPLAENGSKSELEGIQRIIGNRPPPFSLL